MYLLDKRIIQEGDRNVEQWLIRWDGLPASDATWEDTDSVKHRFPALNLEDKNQIQIGGNVMSKSQQPDPVTQDEQAQEPTSVSPVVPGRSKCNRIPSSRIEGYILESLTAKA
ncbi:hypothetical protein Tsubulata_013593 [Turnera subulata]|uniref:Chromo domain-containing protein n=1 Tax=Turnera subulata TaxID=218843 RepID=A0A9Q0FTL2_9ROSI|nr:hypothetical protein Tsubulata_013593 [Turnera subulata]